MLNLGYTDVEFGMLIDKWPWLGQGVIKDNDFFRMILGGPTALDKIFGAGSPVERMQVLLETIETYNMLRGASTKANALDIYNRLDAENPGLKETDPARFKKMFEDKVGITSNPVPSPAAGAQ